MRKINAVLGPLMIILLIVHGVWGAFQLSGIVPGGSLIRAILAFILVTAVAIHTVIGIKLTADTLTSIRRSGASYFKNNVEFWIRRISGFALILFIIYHLCVFMGLDDEIFRLRHFDGVSLAAHILLAVSLIIHLMFNIKPLCIALGIANRKYVKDVIIILSIVLAICAVGFIIYYLRWNILWKYGG